MSRRGFAGASLLLALCLIASTNHGLSWLTQTANAQSVSSSILAEYEKREAETGRDAPAQTRLALWCESQGLTEKKDKHLARALVAAPSYALARGMMGMTALKGRWTDIDAVPDQVRKDADLALRLADYNDRRQKMANTADEHWKMAIWCEDQSLSDEAQAHLTNVIKLDPTRASAWKRLGYKKINGQWATQTQIDANRAETKAQREADGVWLPRLRRLSDMLAKPELSDQAAANLAEIDDPRALPSIWRVFALSRTEKSQQIAVDCLGRISSPLATRGLLELSLRSDSALVRRRAAETLRSRDPREFVPLLIAQIVEPIAYAIQPGDGVATVGSLQLQNKNTTYQRNYRSLSLPETLAELGVRNGDKLGFDKFGQASYQRTIRQPVTLPSPGVQLRPGERLEARITQSLPLARVQEEMRKSATIAQNQLAQDVAAIQGQNDQRLASNDRILALLATYGQNLGHNPDAWSKWWIEDQMGYAYSPTRPPQTTIVQEISSNYNPQVTPLSTTEYGIVRHSCFVAGTPVHTLSGIKPIEGILAGDRVLAIDLGTGDISYRAVITPIRNKPAAVFYIRLEGDDAPVGATGIHRFWKAGQGWVMARDLKIGDTIRTLEGVRKIVKIENGAIQPVFNLEVADRANFFVGQAGLLVHDNSIVESIAQPFDRP